MRTQSEHRRPPPTRTTARGAAAKVGFIVVSLSLLIPILAAAQQVTGCLCVAARVEDPFWTLLRPPFFVCKELSPSSKEKNGNSAKTFWGIILSLFELNPLLSMPDDAAATMIRTGGYCEFCGL